MQFLEPIQVSVHWITSHSNHTTICPNFLCRVVLSFIHSHSQIEIERDKESVIYTHIYLIFNEKNTSLSFSMSVWKQERFRENDCLWDLLCVCLKESEYQKSRVRYIKQNVCECWMWRDNTLSFSLCFVFFLSLSFSLCTSSTISHHNHRLRSIQWNSKHLNNIWMWR
jgi:hypothetical protein